MKHIKIYSLLSVLLLNFLFVKAQAPNYTKEWKQIDDFDKKGLPKSALLVAVKIFNEAVATGNEPQQIKAAMYQMRFRNMVEQDNNENNIFYLDTLIAKAKAPAKNMLQSMQAELFLNYKQNNRWKFYDRTKLAEEKSKDVSTWSIDKIQATIASLYKQSLQNEALLKATDISKYAPIIVKGENTEGLRPTLYDFLAHRALDFFVDTENDVTQPVYKFILNDEKLFAPAADFVAYKFKTKDTASNYYNAVLLLQNLLKFHLQDSKPDALIDADLKRLEFINEHGVFTDKEKLYEQALMDIEKNNMGNQAIAQAIFLRAQLYYDQASEENSNKKAMMKKAKFLLDDIVVRFPKSAAAGRARNLLTNISSPSFSIQTEFVNLPGQPFKSLVTYKNVDKLYFRTIKLSRTEWKKLIEAENNDENTVWTRVLALPKQTEWMQQLPAQSDYQQHKVEIKNNALQEGMYLVLTSLKPEFVLADNYLSRQVIYVSNISYIFSEKGDLNVLHRNSGEPLANASLTLWNSDYDYSARKYIETKFETYNTDNNGYAKLPNKQNRYSQKLQIKWQKDELFTDEQVYTNYHDGYRRGTTKQTFLFTDRSIYRPGQIVFFKGIMVSTDSSGRNSKPLEKQKTTVILYDANYQKQGTLTLTTNNYGSYSGSFKLPEGMLNGQFSIEDEYTKSRQYFSVEEYKRPKFFTEVKKPEGIYKVNDSITVLGNAKAYAGNNIDGAMVKYRVVRKVQYPIWWYWGWRGYGRIGMPYGSGQEMEIANGELVTNADGNFKIRFKAIPDEGIEKKDQPTFIYEVSADVTDINGETRSGNTSVNVAYQSLFLTIDAAENLPADSLNTVKIKSANINDLFIKAKVTVSMYALQSPNKMFRSRYWEKPDAFIMTKEEHDRDFPLDAYNDENDMPKWPLGKQIFTVSDSTSALGKFALPNIKPEPGWYKVIVTSKDASGEEVKAEKFVRIADNNTASTDVPLFVDNKKSIAQPGETIAYGLQTGFDKIFMVHRLTWASAAQKTGYLYLQKGKPYNNSIAITENDRGGLGMDYAFVKNNRLYQGNETFAVPWTNKELTISFETFRDKTLPGSDEKWTVKLSGDKSEKIAAETLISMYDASLDQFKPHNWHSLSNLWPVYNNARDWMANTFKADNSIGESFLKQDYIEEKAKRYDALEENGWSEGYYGGRRTYMLAASMVAKEGTGADSEIHAVTSENAAPEEKRKGEGFLGSYRREGNVKDNEDANASNTNKPAPDGGPTVRKNFNETAFFFPDLKTNEKGNVQFSFTIPEALTTWKTMVLAHTPALASAYAEKTTITQKELMVQPNPTRFMREGDDMEFSAKVVNMSAKEITGTATLELFDAATNKPVDGWFKNVFPTQYFTVAAGQSALVKFPMGIPYSFGSALTYRIKAVTNDGAFRDGEEANLPVLTNRTLVTETLPLNLRNTDSKTFRFDKLLNANNSGSLSHQSLAVEFTTNPTWYAIQALPYLMEYPYECAEQTWNRYYANTLASYIANSMPRIKAVFEKWKTLDTAALQSNLEKNQELKSTLLQETPWVLQARSETQQKKNIAILFDLVRLANEQGKSLGKLREMQSPNGGFVWFKGGPDDRYITQYIVAGIGHLRKLKAISENDYAALKPIVDKAIPYLDARIKEDYDRLLRSKVKLAQNNLWYTASHYLYTRSFFTEYAVAPASKPAVDYYTGQAKKYWLQNSKYVQGMLALALHRSGDKVTPRSVIKSLKENAISHEELGMYWKDFSIGGYFWYQAPVESQAMLIEAFTDIDKNENTINDLKTWLLKQKQVQNWKTTKATAEACYALLLNGSNWLTTEQNVTLQLGNTTITSQGKSVEAGSGYFKETIPGDKVQQGMGNITVRTSPVAPPSAEGSKPPVWGAVYWQYFENLDKITPAETPLKLVKKLFVEKNGDRGPVLQAVNNGDELRIGDKVKVRIELRVDRDMEYVHMKDMRAAAMEPTNVISQYKWQGGLGYYESTKDASTNFFFNWLPRGTYVFEYPMFVTHSGNFSNGITTIQCMYAPEFTAHSEGVRITVAEK